MDAALLKDDYKVFPRKASPRVITKAEIPDSLFTKILDEVPDVVKLFLPVFLLGGIASAIQTVLNALGITSLLARTTIGTVLVWVFIVGGTLIITGFLVYLIIRFERRRKTARIAKLQAEANETALQQVITEAASVTNQLHQILNDSAYCETKLGVSLDEAQSWLRVSQREYDNDRPGPFWDAIETCAYRLSDYDSLGRQLSDYARRYYSLLNGRHHTFPTTFPIDFNQLPDASSAIEDLRRLVDLGQTAEPKPYFYDVWERRQEHRLTRQVMIDEFATLRDVISNVGRVLNQTIGGLRTAVTSGMVQLSEDHAATRKVIDDHAREQTKMLDNIQHGHKPLL